VRLAELALAGGLLAGQSSELCALDAKEGLVALRARHLEPDVGFGERGLDLCRRLEARSLTESAHPGEQSRELPEPGAARQPLLREIAEISGRRARGDVVPELEVVLAKVYDVLARNRKSIKLADRCAADYPELADIWFRGGREGLLAALDAYLDSRSHRGLRRFPDARVRTRLVLETIVFWAVHRYWDPFPQPTEEASARATDVRFLAAALVNDAKR